MIKKPLRFVLPAPAQDFILKDAERIKGKWNEPAYMGQARAWDKDRIAFKSKKYLIPLEYEAFREAYLSMQDDIGATLRVARDSKEMDGYVRNADPIFEVPYREPFHILVSFHLS